MGICVFCLRERAGDDHCIRMQHLPGDDDFRREAEKPVC